jgi:benzoate-CoA ligase
MVNRVGNTLRTPGVDMEQRIALFLYDSPEFACSFFGAIKIGAVPIPTNTNLRPRGRFSAIDYASWWRGR